MITLTASNLSGTFSTTPGGQGVISSSGPWAPGVVVRATYCLYGSSGNFVGIEGGIWKGNFQHVINFPGSQLNFEMVQADDGYSAINIETVCSD